MKPTICSGRDSFLHHLRQGSLPVCCTLTFLLVNCASYTPLLKSARDGKLDNIRTMLSSGQNINEQNEEGITALMLAAQNNHPSVVSFLLANGAKTDLKETYGNTALHYAKKCVECAKSILEKGGNVDAVNNKGATPLMFAANANNPDGVKFFIAAGADVNAIGHGGLTPLLFAVLAGDTMGAIEALVKAGAAIEHADSMEHLTPVFHAALDGNVKATAFLLAAGADICATDTAGKPILEVIGENITKGIWKNAGTNIYYGGAIGAGLNAAFNAVELRKKMKPIIRFLENSHAPENAQQARECTKRANRPESVATAIPAPIHRQADTVIPAPVNQQSDIVETSPTETISEAVAAESTTIGDDGISETVLDTETVPSVQSPIIADTTTPDTATCFPPCRTGYLCHQGTCLSRCNPACPQGSLCSEQGECIESINEVIGTSTTDQPSQEQPEEIPVSSRENRRYKGFFMELRPLGVGIANAQLQYGFGVVDFTSPIITSFGCSIGGAPIENLSIFGSWEFGFAQPLLDKVQLKANGYTINDSIIKMYLFLGPGIRYNFPGIAFIGIEAGLMVGPTFSNNYDDEDDRNDWYAIEDSTAVPSSTTPLYIRFEAGKEWWISPKWTIGIGMNITYGKSAMAENTYYRSWFDPEITIRPEMRNFVVATSIRLGRH